MGKSLRSEQPVTRELWPPLKNTMAMVALGTVFSIVFGVLVGVVCAWRRGTWADKGGLWSGLAFYSMPPQWLAPDCALRRRLVGPAHRRDQGSDPRDPRRCLLVGGLRRPHAPHDPSRAHAGLVLYGVRAVVRSAMLETLGEDYVLTARAKGLSNWRTVRTHGLRNALLPIVTLVALSLGFIIGGSITIEYVFSYPGIGLEVVEAIDQRDYPILQGAFLLLTLAVIEPTSWQIFSIQARPEGVRMSASIQGGCCGHRGRRRRRRGGQDRSGTSPCASRPPSPGSPSSRSSSSSRCSRPSSSPATRRRRSGRSSARRAPPTDSASTAAARTWSSS